jgi:hypothetical protein
MFHRIIGWLLKWTYSVEKAMLVPSLAQLFVVDYWSQMLICLKIAYVGKYALRRTRGRF